MRQATIYEVLTYEGLSQSYWYFGHKQAAQYFRADWLLKNPSPDNHATLHELSFPLNKEGVATAMNHVITILCANEH